LQVAVVVAQVLLEFLVVAVLVVLELVTMVAQVQPIIMESLVVQ
jgi:hypothetical protein